MWVGGVRVVIRNEENKILMVCQHHEEKDIWMIPGGGVEAMETSFCAAQREVKEETGLDIEVNNMIWHIEQLKQVKSGTGLEQRFVDYFEGTVVGGELQLGRDPEFDAEHQRLKDIKYMSQEEICQLEHVYPTYLRDELWEYFKIKDSGYNPYKIRV